MALKAENMPVRDEQGWQNYAQRFLENDANNSKAGLITTPPKDSANATANLTGRSRSGFHSKDLDFSDILAANAYLASASGHGDLREPGPEPDASEGFAVEFTS
ncbi:hypothetical protein [Hymenobacter wooponensis]|uniref:Uncharacterized protein n=1 Tax=Hymenobacter wooponensis TaxID=1525360 RepID=A0A4Z0MTQ8_9BACT|nr:hypothetical protein [Hymenobacter wooponensis]TGD82849.1 hypothetical protein EU557_03455 [Hymenobacter wooponensis]